MEGMNASDVALLARDNDGWGGGGIAWIIVLFALIFGGNGWGNNGFANAIGYENLATSNEVQRGFDNQNSMANQREILAAVNQNFHDTAQYVGDKYSEIQRDIAAIQVAQANALANQNQCCCDIRMEIQQAASANALQMSQMEARLNSKMDQNEITTLRDQVQQLQLAQAMNGVVRYPDSFAYNAGNNPFCGCNTGCCNI